MRPWPRRRSDAAAGPRLSTRLAVGLLIGAAVLLLDRQADDLPEVQRLELLTLDWRFRLRGTRQPGPDLLLVMVDDRSVEALGRWPPPREAIAAAVERLTSAGAGPIVLNLLLAAPAETLPPAARAALGDTLPLLPADAAPLRAEITGLLDRDRGDARLAAAVAASGRVVLPYAFTFDARGVGLAATPPGETPPWVAATAYPGYLRPPGVGEQDLGARGLLVPEPALAAAAAGAGNATLLVDDDGALRFDLPAFPFAEDYYPSLAVEAARLRLGLARDRIVPHLGEALAVGDRLLPLDRRSRLLVNHYGPEGTFPTVSLAELLDGRVDPGRLSGRLVILGASAAATGDRFATPFTSRLPGSEHLAAAIDNILHDRPLRRDAPVRLADALAVIVLALAAALLAGRRSLPLSLAATGLLAGGWIAVTAAALWSDLWLALVTPILATVLAGGTVEALRAGREQGRRRRLERQRANLARYFAPSVVDRLAAADRPASLDSTHEATVMFVDMVGSTRVSEGLTPAAAMDLMRAFHARIERAVFDHGGMLERFMGDGALACFGVPDPSPTAPADALRAARTLLASVEAWSVELEAEGRPAVRLGIGIHAGPVLSGDIGGERQFQFTVIGDTVNVASRLEALTRHTGTSLIASDAVVERVRAAGEGGLLAGLEPLPPQEIRGRHGRIAVWRLATAGLDAPVPGPKPLESLRGE